MIKIDKYFKNKIIEYEEIKGHFNTNFKVRTNYGLFHLKIFNDRSYSIEPWIDGDVIKVWDKKTIKLVCTALEKLHNSNDIFENMDFRANDINDSRYKKLVNKYKNSLVAPCHNDLNRDNIVIGNGKANLIDFEFSRMNNIHWEVANIVNEDNLSEQQINLFLEYYPTLNKKTLYDFIYINKKFVTWWNHYQISKKNDLRD